MNVIKETAGLLFVLEIMDRYNLSGGDAKALSAAPQINFTYVLSFDIKFNPP